MAIENTYKVQLRGDLSFEERVARAGICLRENFVTEENFPITDTRTGEEEFVIVSVRGRFKGGADWGSADYPSTGQVLELIDQLSLKPAPAEIGFDFAAQYPTEERGSHIYFLRSPWHSQDYWVCYYVGLISAEDIGWNISTTRQSKIEDAWNVYCKFAAFRK